MSRKYIQIAFSILLLAGLALGFAIKDGALAQSDSSSKIEAVLLNQLNTGPTDFFVVMTQKADLSAADRLQTKVEKGQYVFNTLVSTANRTQADIRSYLDKNGINYKSYYIVNTILVKGGDLALATTIADRSDVSAINANHGYQLEQPINPRPSTTQPQYVEPNISFVKADQVWAMGITGQGTVLAGNDTGLDETHPAIAPHYRGCLNPPTCTVWDNNYNWWDATGTYPTDPYDGFGHGTHTTGTMVGDDGAGNQIGMAPGAQTIHCKLMDDGGYATDEWITTCFQWDLAPWDLTGSNPDPSKAPDAVNNSWGWPGGGVNSNREATDALLAAGIVAEFSAGNEGSGCQTLRSPGDFVEVFTTGSVNHAGGVLPGTLTGFSSRGPSVLDPGYFPDFMAPGENIRSSLPGNQYAYWGGTSMAGPHVTALIGLMWSANPALKGQIDTTYSIIQQSVVPLTGQNGSNCGGDYSVGPNNDWGYGTIDALGAVQLAIAMGGSGQMDGHVTDGISGNPIEGATVHALHEDGFAWDTQTDATGYYTMTVGAGIFEVTASHPLYVPTTVTGVEVITDTLTTQNIVLIPRGKLIGYVTDFDNGFPLVGATVTASDGTVATTLDNGYYEMYLEQGTYTVTATMQDYAPEAVSVDIAAGEETQQDFALKAAIVFSPSPLHVTLDLGDTSNTGATILNRLPTDYAFEFQEKDGGFVPSSVKNSTTATPLPVVENPGTASVVNLTAPFGTAEFNPARPDVWTGAASYPQTIVRYAKVQCPGENNSFYIFGGVSDGAVIGNARRFDANSNTWTDLAQMPSFNEGENGVCYEGKIYVTVGGGAQGFLIYDIASDSWSSGPVIPRGVECGAMAAWNGKVYIIGGDDNFYPLDGVSDQVNVYDIETNSWVTNGTSMPTGVSNDGFVQLGQYVYIVGGWSNAFPTNANVTQRYDLENDAWELGATFTPAKADFPLAGTSEFLYAIAGDQDGGGYWDSSNTVWRYDFNSWPNGVWEDTGDNLPFAIQAHFGGFATDAFTGGEVWSVGGLEGSSFTFHADSLYKEAEPPWSPIPPDVPWIGEVPVSGTVSAGETLPVSIYFTATQAIGINQPGDYLATLKISGDPKVNVPVVMTVLPPANWGKFDGTITDKCTNEPIEGTLVEISGGVPISQTTADENGYYSAWIEQGTYSVTYSASGYFGTSDVVDILPGEITTANVALIPNRPCISVNPDFIEAWVLTDTAVYTTGGLKLTDLGGIDLTYEFREKPGGYTQTLKIETTPGALSTVLSPDFVSKLTVSKSNGFNPYAGTVAIFKDQDPWGTTEEENILTSYGIPYEVHTSSDFDTLDFNQFSMIVIAGGQTDGFYAAYGIYANKFEEYVDGGGFLNFIAADFGNLHAPLPGGMTWTFTPQDCNVIVDPAHPVVQGVPNPFCGTSGSHGFFSNLPADGHVIATQQSDGQPTIVEYPIGSGWLMALGQPLEYSYFYGQDAGPILVNTLLYGNQYIPVGDVVPWVTEVPVSGTVTAGSTSDIGIYFTSQYTDGTPMPLGTYTATLLITNDDPVAPRPNIPVIMHIVSEYLAPTADFSATTPVNVGDPTVFTNLTEGGIPPANTFEWNFGDGITMTVSTLDPVNHVYVTFGSFTVTLKACNSQGLCDTATKVVDVLPKVILLPLVNRN